MDEIRTATAGVKTAGHGQNPARRSAAVQALPAVTGVATAMLERTEGHYWLGRARGYSMAVAMPSARARLNSRSTSQRARSMP